MPTPDYTKQFNTSLDPFQEQQFLNWLQQSNRQSDLYDYDLRGAFKDGLVQQGGSGHLPDTYKKPNHPTFSNESVYSNGVFKGGAWEKNGEKWTFKATPHNLQMYQPADLQRYFSEREPGNSLVMP